MAGEEKKEGRFLIGGSRGRSEKLFGV